MSVLSPLEFHVLKNSRYQMVQGLPLVCEVCQLKPINDQNHLPSTVTLCHVLFHPSPFHLPVLCLYFYDSDIIQTLNLSPSSSSSWFD